MNKIINFQEYKDKRLQEILDFTYPKLKPGDFRKIVKEREKSLIDKQPNVINRDFKRYYQEFKNSFIDKSGVIINQYGEYCDVKTRLRAHLKALEDFAEMDKSLLKEF